MNLNQSAIANWAEDEAHLSAIFALELFATEGRDYYHQWLIKERSVIHNVFDGDKSLINRFMIKFNAMTSSITNLYF
jgi:hypothetical protein